MFSTPKADRLRARFLSTFVLASALGCLSLASGAVARPQDLPQQRPTAQARFNVRVSSDVMPVPMGRIHAWRVHIADTSGSPLTQAIVQVTGGMPEHHHGLPTQPRVMESATPGDYVINGVRFSMTGRWVLNLDIRARDGRSDTVTFSFVL